MRSSPPSARLAIAAPILDPDGSAQRYYRIGLDPSRWLFAVVNFNETPARIATAHGNRKDPPGWTTT